MQIKDKLQAGQKVYGTMLRVSRSSATCILLKRAGLDFYMFDCEQSIYSYETMHDLYIIGNQIGLAGMLRVPILSKEHISRSLDIGATGVMIPMTETPEHAKELVRWSKYLPVGERGYASGGAMTAYAPGGNPIDNMRLANNKVLSIAQIETRLAVDNAEQIAGVEGIDVLLIGPNDLSVSLGVPGDIMNPVQLEAMAYVAAVCKKSGKAFGLHAGKKLLEKFREETDFVMCMSDTDIIFSGFSTLYDGIK